MRIDGRVVRVIDLAQYTFREIEIGDANAVQDYLKQVTQESDYLMSEPDEVHSDATRYEEHIQSYISDPRQVMVIAMTDDHKIISIGSINKLLDRRRCLHKGSLGISVRKDYWGQGIASRITTMLIDWASAHAILEKIELGVAVDNYRACKLYEKFGFQQEGMCYKSLRIGENHYLDEIRMYLMVDG